MTWGKMELFFWLCIACLLVSAALSPDRPLLLLPLFASFVGLLACLRWMGRR
jgi:hypothetical protein